MQKLYKETKSQNGLLIAKEQIKKNTRMTWFLLTSPPHKL